MQWHEFGSTALCDGHNHPIQPTAKIGSEPEEPICETAIDCANRDAQLAASGAGVLARQGIEVGGWRLQKRRADDTWQPARVKGFWTAGEDAQQSSLPVSPGWRVGGLANAELHRQTWGRRGAYWRDFLHRKADRLYHSDKSAWERALP